MGRDPNAKYKVQDFMQRKLPHITPETEMTTAISELQKFKLLGAPVVR